MSRFSGPQGKGAMRLLREIKREEAEARNALTPVSRTKAYRLGKVNEKGERIARRTNQDPVKPGKRSRRRKKKTSTVDTMASLLAKKFNSNERLRGAVLEILEDES